VFFVSACTTKAGVLSGTYSSNSGLVMSLTFNGKTVKQISDGQTYEGTYKVEGNSLELNFDGTVVYYKYDAAADVIELEGQLYNYVLTKGNTD
jgi:hypothetical protein